MPDRSLYVPVVLTLVAGLSALGFYFYIDAASLARQQDARLTQAVEQNTRAIEKLTELVRMGPAVAAVGAREPGADVAAKPETRGKPGARFANDDLRDPGAEPGGVLRTSTQAFSGNLNYIINNEAMVGAIWGRCIDSLATRHNLDVLRFEPLLAESWEVTPDGLTFTIKLRQDAVWHEYVDPVTKREVPATPVTSDDFIFFWEVMQNPEIPCDAYRTYFKLLDRIEAVDDHTLRVVWKEPYSLATEQTLGLSPLPRHYYRPDPAWDDKRFVQELVSSPRNQWIVGCGPYRVEKWDATSGLTLVVSDSYYGPRPAIRRMEYRLIKDPNISLIELKKGNLDDLSLSPEQWVKEALAPDFYAVTENPDAAIEDSLNHDRLKKAGRSPSGYTFEKFQYKRFSWFYIGYNLQRPLFADRRVRVALTQLTDRRRILEEVYYGLGSLFTGPFVPQSPYYNQDVPQLAFDPEAAKALLNEAGWEDTDGDGWLDKDVDGDGKRDPFRYTFLAISSSENQRRFAAIIQQDLKAAGIDMQIKPTEWSVYQQFLEEKNFDVCSLGWAGGIENDPYQIWHSSQAGVQKSSNHIGYKSEEADKLIEEGRRTTDLDRRIAIYRKFHEVIARDQPYTFLICPTALVAQHKRFRNARVYVQGMDSSLMWIPAAEQIP